MSIYIEDCKKLTMLPSLNIAKIAPIRVPKTNPNLNLDRRSSFNFINPINNATIMNGILTSIEPRLNDSP